MDQPAWLMAAWGELGVAEGAGGTDNPRIVSYYDAVGRNDVRHDDVPWCAAFAGAMLARAGLSGTGSLLARSYLNWGEAIEAARTGAIAVLERGGEPWAGHVGFVVGEDQERIYLLGGNQSDAVTVEGFARSRLISFRWPAAASGEARPKPDAVGSDPIFEASLRHVLEMEGGFTDDRYDPGGPTNRGITLAVYARWRSVTIDASSRARLIDDLKRIPDDVVGAIYRARYWTPAKCDALPGAVALFHFDAAVNHGVSGAAKMLQQAAGVDVDGEIGPATLSAIARLSPQAVIDEYAAIRRARYRSLPHFWRFGRGWLNRVAATEKAADDLLARTNALPTISKGASAMEPIQYPDTAPRPDGKWWAQSKTIWGALITATATVLPVLGPLIGIDLSGDTIRQAGEQGFAAVQAIVGLFGTLLTIYGRVRASGPLTRRAMSLRL